MSSDRHSIVPQQELITDPDKKARREAENGVLQFNLALELIRDHVKDHERPFQLRSHHILQSNWQALTGIHPLAGTFRNTPVEIQQSTHKPVEFFRVAEEIEHMCSYVNQNWENKNAIHLSSYVMWKLNWIHPFADGNGRTSRIISYVVLSIKLDSLLPGSETIPDQIAANKTPYYDALEAADEKWLQSGDVDVSEMENLLESMLAKQLVGAANEAVA